MPSSYTEERANGSGYGVLREVSVMMAHIHVMQTYRKIQSGYIFRWRICGWIDEEWA